MTNDERIAQLYLEYNDLNKVYNENMLECHDSIEIIRDINSNYFKVFLSFFTGKFREASFNSNVCIEAMKQVVHRQKEIVKEIEELSKPLTK